MFAAADLYHHRPQLDDRGGAAGGWQAAEVALGPWNDRMEHLPSIFGFDPDYEPSVERPLVYHLFGQVDVRWPFVLTEDDYFGYMLGMGANRELIPERVRRGAGRPPGLLFVGFRLDGWDFRALPQRA